MGMLRCIRRFLRRNAINKAIDLARRYNRQGVACAMRSDCPDGAWMTAARLHWARRDAFMWEARRLAE